MKKISIWIIIFLSNTSFIYADLNPQTPTQTTPNSIIINDTGIVEIDNYNKRYVTGCWEDNINNVYYYKDKSGNITHAEICNEPDREVHGLGNTPQELAQNYYDFLVTKSAEIKNQYPDIHIVLGSLSGYNYPWIKEFLNKPNVCNYFDVFSFHPYHFGVAPDDIDTTKNAYHTVEQWTNFYRKILADENCIKPIWVTEFGYTTTTHLNEQQVTIDEQINYALRELIILLSLGVQRIGYFNGLDYQLTTENVSTYNFYTKLLNNSRYYGHTQSGENYCPRTGSCFYDNSEYRKDANISHYGLNTDPKNTLISQDYIFSQEGHLTHLTWDINSTLLSYQNIPFTLTDIDNHPAYTAILDLQSKGILQGYSDLTYKPDNTINRAEFTKIIIASSHPNKYLGYQNCFPDASEEWYAPYVCFAQQNNIISGYSNGTFGPSNDINLAEAAKIILKGFNISTSEDTNLWYKNYLTTLQDMQAIPTTILSAEQKITRGEMAQIIYRMLINKNSLVQEFENSIIIK